jgi:small subunit ribosomal protein S16
MVRIRLRRVGAKNQPSYRIVAAEKEAPRDGRFLEVLGHYNPRTEPSTVLVDEERLFDWMKNGAQPSDAVFKALRSLGTWERWERFKQGESMEKLLEEAKKAGPEVDPRTRRDDLFGKSNKKKRSKKSAEEPAAEVAEVVEDAPTD